ncbi:epithelial membrane protein 3-like [Ruditapes philippinarum]|uniref:epithelial membrane protein 3-like n=1 Tax=Ruditapes philippinarum TaxID=129788 RepID=UPI00295AE0EF|nr:epithelial membrane protein 3-like [Ruditapes philippinarum]
MADSFFLVIAVTTFALGIVLFLVSISSTSWQGLDGGVTISLWKVCYRHHVDKSWFCNSWHEIPGFVRLAQVFCIISLLCCIVCLILIAAFVLRCLHRSKLALIVLSLLTFTSACMITIAVIVMGIKGREYLLELKEDDDEMFKYFLKGIIISGFYEIGWAFILAIVASLIDYISFGFFLLEYQDMTDTN